MQWSVSIRRNGTEGMLQEFLDLQKSTDFTHRGNKVFSVSFSLLIGVNIALAALSQRNHKTEHFTPLSSHTNDSSVSYIIAAQTANE